MQTGHYEGLPQRMRYYQGTIDQHLIEQGMPFEMLRESWVIFICEKDVIGRGRHLYSFSLREDKDGSLVLDDKAHRIIFCLEGVGESLTERQKDLVGSMTGDGTTELGQRIRDEVTRSRYVSEWRREYMKYEFDMAMARREGRMEGRAEGRSEGLADALTAVLRVLRKYGKEEQEIIREVRENPEFAEVTDEQIRERLASLV